MREVRASPARQSAAVVAQLDDAALLLVAARTARRAEQILALARQRVGRLKRVRRLPRQPHIELGARHGYHLEPHIRVHHAAELRALPEELARLIRLKPHRIVVVRYHINLARQLWHPEAVDDIHRIQAEAHRLAHRNEQLIRHRYLLLRVGGIGIPELEPPLMADDINLEMRRPVVVRILRVRGVEYALYGWHCRHYQDENRDHRPDDLQFRVAVRLRGIAVAPAPKAHYHIDERALYQDEDDGSRRQYHIEDE